DHVVRLENIDNVQEHTPSVAEVGPDRSLQNSAAESHEPLNVVVEAKVVPERGAISRTVKKSKHVGERPRIPFTQDETLFCYPTGEAMVGFRFRDVEIGLDFVALRC